MGSRVKIILLVLYLIFCVFGPDLSGQDSLSTKQELYNGRIWINRYLMVKGNQFLFSRAFLPGSVTMRGETFHVNLRYDIFEDEIQTIAGHFGFLQINKELVDSFTISFNNRTYRFISVRNDTLAKPLTYYNILYSGSSSLYVSWLKKINKLPSGEASPAFYEINRIFLVRDGVFNAIRRKADLMYFLSDQKENLRNYIKKNHIRVRPWDPWSFIPLVRYYEILLRK